MNQVNKKIYICGAGRIGLSVYKRLADEPEFDCYLVDNTFPEEIKNYNIRQHQKDYFIRFDFRKPNSNAMYEIFKDADVILNCLPYQLNDKIIHTALVMKCHYFDLSEDTGSYKLIDNNKRTINENKLIFVPGCGIAPGIISNIAGNLIRKEFGSYDNVIDVELYVGALPQNPTNSLKYNLTWSPDGLVNEYCNPCEGVIDHRYDPNIPPLSQVVSVNLQGVEYEAFTTSGGIGTLHNSLILDGNPRNVLYRTLRFPGHLDKIRFLYDDLYLSNDRQMFKELMKRIPETDDDYVIFHVDVVGMMLDGRKVRRTYTNRIDATQTESAIQIVTSHGMAEMVKKLLYSEDQYGIIKNEDVDLII